MSHSECERMCLRQFSMSFHCCKFITMFITVYIIDLEIRMEVLKTGHCCAPILRVLCGVSAAWGKQIHLAVKLCGYGQTWRKENQSLPVKSSLYLYSFFPGYIIAHVLESFFRSPEALFTMFWIRKYWGLQGLVYLWCLWALAVHLILLV